MNDWLDKILQNAKASPRAVLYKSMWRMARGLRELAGKIKDVQELCEDTPEGSEQNVLDDAITDIVHFLKYNLSDDAKELLK